MQLHKDWSIPAVTAGFVAVLISYSGPWQSSSRRPRARKSPPP